MTTKTEVTLSKPSEWNAWYEDFVSRAETSKIFDFVDIDRDSPILEEPKEPMTSEEMLMQLDKAALDAWERASQQNAETAEERPEPLADLSDRQWLQLTRLQSEYRVKLATFANRQRAYAELAVWVRSTVDKSYLGNTTSRSDLRSMVRDLKSSLAPSEDEQKEEARLRYRQVLAQTKRVKPEDWLVTWNKAKLEGEKQKIAELEGQSAINDFLAAVSAFDATWASQQKIQIMNSKKFGFKMDVTLRALGELFHEQVRSTRMAGKLSDSAFSASDVVQSPCPCGLRTSIHRWKPIDCAAVQIAIHGESKDGRHVKSSRVNACKEVLKQAKWKSLMDSVKASKATAKTSQPEDKENPRKHGDFAGLTIDTKNFSSGTTDAVFTALREKHPLYNSTIYDGGATTHIVNDKSLLIDIREAEETDYVMIGEGSLKVEARGTRRMENVLDGEDGRNTRALVLLDVAYVPRFHTNIISAKRLEKKGLWRCGVDNTLRMGTYEDNDVLCRLTDKYDLDVVEYKPVPRSYFRIPRSLVSVFNAFQHVFSSFRANNPKPKRQRMTVSRVPPQPRLDASEIWHRRACHAGPRVLEQLVLQTRGVRIKGPTMVQCTACGTSKATEIISRRESPHRSRQPFYRVFIDIFEFPAAYNGRRYLLLITDEFSGMMFSWSLMSKPEVSNIIKDFEARIKRHTGASICKIRIDNERTIINLPFQRDSEFQVWATEAGIDIELPPPQTKEPTGGAERPGGINQVRMRCMIGLLPQELWPEFYRAAVWIHNILPSQRNEWMSPKEKMDRWFHQHFRWYRPPNVDFDATKDLRPDWHGIYAYGCKAYPLISRYKAGKDVNQFKLGPRAHVGYLVGYHASNIYRIWVPKLNQVILSRDVRFNEVEFFDPAKEEQLDTEVVAEYRPTPQALTPLPQRDWDTLLGEFLHDFDNHVLGFDPEGSNSGVEDAGGTMSGVEDTTSQPVHPPSQNRLFTPPIESPMLPTPESTPQLDRRDASPALSSTGSNTSTPDAPLQTGTSSPAQRSLDVSHGDSTESPDRSPVEITLDTIVVQPLITHRRPSDGLSMQPDTQPSSDLQPVPARGETRTRRSPVGHQSQHGSTRITGTTFSLPCFQRNNIQRETSQHFTASFSPPYPRQHATTDFIAMTLYDSQSDIRI
jgi:hypothetical protein